MITPRPLPTAYPLTTGGPPCDLWLDGRAGLRWPATTGPAVALERYPSTSGLESDLADHWGLAPDQVVVTAGADEALDRACRAFLAPDRRAVLTDPTFAMLPRYVALAGADLRQVSWWDGPLPLDDLVRSLDGQPGLLAVVSPCNPTGLVAGTADLLALADRCPQAVVVADLAYVEFADADPTATLLTRPNILVTRTLSKAWGLAGARLGYALGPARLIDALRAAGAPYPTGAAGLALARERLRSGRSLLVERVARTRLERARLGRLLQAGGLAAPPSQANFLLARGRRAGWLADALGGLGIAVRRWDDQATRLSLPANGPDFRRLWAGCRSALAPEALLLDIDGVVADVSGSYREAIRLTAADLGAPVSAAEVAAAKALPDSNNDWRVTLRLLRERGKDVDLDTVRTRFEALLQDGGLWRRERLIADRDLLARLARRVPLAAVTGRPRRDLERFLATNDLTGLFAATICLEDAPAKPSPEPVRLALRRLGVRRGWLVGDTPDDLAAARAAGVVPLGVVAPGDPVAGTTERLTDAGAARVLTSLSDLEELLS
jgi:HAD superfamily hydrolase (TIGR01548 family)